MKRPLVLIGGGEHCKSVIDVAESIGREILGILDKPQNIGKFILGYQIIGSDEDIPKYVDKADFVITIGFVKDVRLRIYIDSLINRAGGKRATLVASTAYVSKYAEIAEGTVIMHRAVVNVGAKIGVNCIINTLADIDHDVKIGDFCHISAQAMICGGTKIGEQTYVGSGAVVRDHINIGGKITIGMGSVVTKSLIEDGVYVGNPAHLIK